MISVSLFIFFLGFRKNSDIFHPARFWICLWTMVIGVTLLDLSYYQREWSIKAWFIILSGVVAYPLGVLMDTYLNRNRIYEKIPFPKNYLNQIIKKNAFRQTILGGFLIYICVYLLEWKIEGYLPFFTIFKESQRTDFGVFGLHVIVSILPILILLTSEFLLLYKQKFLSKVGYISISIFGLITYLLLLNRLFLFMLGFMMILVYHYLHRRVNLKIVIIMVLIFSFAFWGIGELRSTQFIGNFVYNVSDMKYSEEYANFTGPYMYVAMNLENVAYGVDHLRNHHYGANILDWVYAIMGLQDSFNDYLRVDKHQYLVTKSFTTLSYMWYMYADFGILGVILGSFLWGQIMSRLYNNMRAKPSLNLINLYAILMFMVFLSFFTFMPSMLNTVFQIMSLTALTWYIEHPAMFRQS